MQKNKNRIVIIVIIVLLITGGVCYYNKIKLSSINTDESINNKSTDVSTIEEINDDEDITQVDNYDTKNILGFENDDVVSMSMGILSSNRPYTHTKLTKNKTKIQAIVEYLKTLKMVETEYKAIAESADDGISFTDKNNKRYHMSFYGNMVRFEVDDKVSGPIYELPDYNREELLKICAEAGFRDDAGNKITY